MSVNVTNIPHLHRETVKRLKNLEHFSDFMLWAWAVAEENIEIMFIEQFDIHYLNTKSKESLEFLKKAGLAKFADTNAKKAEFLLKHIQTSGRLELLYSMGMFTTVERQAIGQLVADRKSLFHGKQWQSNVLGRSDGEKMKIMDNAYSAVFAIFSWTLKTIFRDLKNPIDPESFMDAPTELPLGAS